MSASNKLKVAFSPTEDMWSHQAFRDLIKEMVLDEANTDLYIVTTNTDDELISDVISESKMEASNSFQIATDDLLVAKLISLDVRLFLSDDLGLNRKVDLEDEILLVKNQVTGCKSILINNILDQSRVQMKYYSLLSFWTDQINRYN